MVKSARDNWSGPEGRDPGHAAWFALLAAMTVLALMAGFGRDAVATPLSTTVAKSDRQTCPFTPVGRGRQEVCLLCARPLSWLQGLTSSAADVLLAPLPSQPTTPVAAWLPKTRAPSAFHPTFPVSFEPRGPPFAA